MSNFNFGSLANSTGVASDKRLRAYSINKVKFVEAKLTQIHSEKNGSDYDVLNVRWENQSGYYEENLFLPGTSGRDVERQPNNWGGEMPSNADRAMMFFAHLLSVLNPDGFAKLKKVVGQAKSFTDVANMVVKLVNEKKGIECYLKLGGRTNEGVTYAAIPFYAAINKDGEAYINNNFLSLKDDLGFTPSEDKKRVEFENARPTPAPSDNAPSASDALDAQTEGELNSLLDSL